MTEATFLTVHVDDGNTYWPFESEKKYVSVRHHIPVWPKNATGHVVTIRYGKVGPGNDHFYYGYNHTGCKHVKCTLTFRAPLKDVKAAGIDLAKGAKEVNFHG